MVAVVNCDGFTPFFTGEWADADDVRAYLSDVADSGAELEWCPGPCGGVFTHDTAIGEVFGQYVIDNALSWPRAGDETASDTVRAMIAADDDTLAVVVSECASLGITLHASIRMGHFRNDSIGDVLNGPIWRDNPSMRIDDGIDSSLDFAYATVRDYWLSIISEMVGYGVTNVSLDFMRYPEFTTSQSAMTAFVEAARPLVSGTLSARVSTVHTSELLDVDNWPLDRLIVSQHGGGSFGVSPWVKAGRQLLFGEEVTGQMGHVDLAARAVDWHAAGADGVHLFNIGTSIAAAHYVGDATHAADLAEHTGQIVDPGQRSGPRRFVHRHEAVGLGWDGDEITGSTVSRGVFWNDDAGQHYTQAKP